MVLDVALEKFQCEPTVGSVHDWLVDGNPGSLDMLHAFLLRSSAQPLSNAKYCGLVVEDDITSKVDLKKSHFTHLVLNGKIKIHGVEEMKPLDAATLGTAPTPPTLQVIVRDD